jgi:diguanylate cyclase (GGDEF)-like protein
MNHVEFMAVHDPLTDLPNRRMLDEHLELVAATAFRHNYLAALFYFDLDGFKSINDDLGHKAGDMVLIELSKRLAEWTRKGDLICRVGGDEFVVLISNIGTNRSEAKQASYVIGEKIHELTARPIDYDEKEISVGCSIGVCLIGKGQESAASAIHEADVAMYKAKRARDGLVVFADEVKIDQYSLSRIGNAQVDDEHAAIDCLISQAWDAVGDRTDLVNKIVESSADHFSHEETTFSGENIVFEKAHALAHKRLLTYYQTLASEMSEKNVDETLLKIAKSLRAHFEQHDVKLL